MINVAEKMRKIAKEKQINYSMHEYNSLLQKIETAANKGDNILVVECLYPETIKQLKNEGFTVYEVKVPKNSFSSEYIFCHKIRW